MTSLVSSIRKWYQRKVYRPGQVLSRFVACDVVREIRIISVDRIDEGLILGQVRTNNILYVKNELIEEQGFSEPMILDITKMWAWSGKSWGGLPDGTSIADHLEEKDID